MADELKIVRGEGLWQDKYNRLVDTVEKMGGVVDQLHWITSSDGVVFLNGWKGQLSYVYTQIGDKKIVNVRGAVKGNAPAGKFTDILTIPDNVMPRGRMIQCHWWNNAIQITNNTIGVYSPDVIKESTTNDWNLVFEFTYVC